jgi:hypothetical protein
MASRLGLKGDRLIWAWHQYFFGRRIGLRTWAAEMGCRLKFDRTATPVAASLKISALMSEPARRIDCYFQYNERRLQAFDGSHSSAGDNRRIDTKRKFSNAFRGS